jgi:sugar phosphate isomerase/epimerase
MIRLSAFADEISPDLSEQIDVLRNEGIRFLDLRAVWGTNVLDLTDQQVAGIKQSLDRHGVGVAAIGSPIGKVPIDHSLDDQLRRLERAILLAEVFGTPFIRIFSFYPATSNPAPVSAYRDEVVARLRVLTERARHAGITLLHENDTGLYGDTIARCVDVMQSVDDAHLRAVLDPANFIQSQQAPFPDGYEALRPWLRYIHVKDALRDGTVVPAGEGEGRWPELLSRLRDDGYDGFFSLEPHLAAAGQFQGFSSPDLFRRASQALQQMLRAMAWECA